MGSKETKPLENEDWFADRPCDTCQGRNRCHRIGTDHIRITCDGCGGSEIVTRGTKETSRRIGM